MTVSPAHALRAAAEALALPIRDDQIATLLDYLALLQHWNATYNLTAVRDPESMLTQHVVDCLAVVAPLRRHSGGDSLRLLDVGSGGGLPGVVIAAMASEVDVVCVDAVGKKAAFVRQAAAELHLGNLRAAHSRVEQLQIAPSDVVTSRAFGSLANLVALTRPLLRDNGIWMAMKGKRPDEEILSVGDSIEVFHVEQLTVPGLGAERCLVWMRSWPRTG